MLSFISASITGVGLGEVPFGDNADRHVLMVADHDTGDPGFAHVRGHFLKGYFRRDREDTIGHEVTDKGFWHGGDSAGRLKNLFGARARNLRIKCVCAPLISDWR